jgi:hypothetical protein
MTLVVLAALGVPLWLVVGDRCACGQPVVATHLKRAPVTAVPTTLESPGAQMCVRATS